MRYFFDKHDGSLKLKDPTETIELTEHYTWFGNKRIDKTITEVVDHAYDKATNRADLEEYVDEGKQEILRELEQLDKTITRLLEEYFESVNYTPHSKVAEVVERKKELREQLSTLT